MKRIIRLSVQIILLSLSIIGCTNNPSSPQETVFYEKYKNQDFSIFTNWQIYPRENSKALVCDYYLGDSLLSRYLILDYSDEVYVSYKTVMPSVDSLAKPLPKSGVKNNQISSKLLDKFLNLQIEALYSLDDGAILIFDINDSNSVLYVDENINIDSYPRFKNYKKINKNWYSYEN